MKEEGGGSPRHRHNASSNFASVQGEARVTDQSQSERDFAIDVLQLLSKTFPLLHEATSRVVSLYSITCSAFREVFADFILRRGYTHVGCTSLEDIPLKRYPPPQGLAVDEEELDRKLLQLFSNVDCTGRGVVTWDQMIMFFIDTSMMGRGSDFTDFMKGYLHVGSAALSDDSFHTCRLAACRGRFLLTGRQCQTLELHKFDPHRSGSPLFSLHFQLGEKVSSLSAVYLTEQHLLVVSCTDLKIRVFETWRSCKQRRCFRTPDSCLCLRDSGKSGVLFCGTRSGMIRALASNSLVKESSSEVVLFTMSPHTDGVTEILLLGDGCIASSSLDGTVAISTEEGTPLYNLSKKAGPGITRMALLQLGDDGTRFLVTCGFETEARMWLVQHTITVPFTLRDAMSPHTAPVVDVAAVQAVPHVITLDAVGVIKIWDAKNWQPAQTIKCDAYPSPRAVKKWQSLCYDPETKRLVALSNTSVILLDYGAPSVTERVTSDDTAVSAISHDCVRGVFVIASGSSIKMWDAFTGQLQMLHTNAVEANATITALCISETGRRLYVGTSKGKVTSHNASSGVTLCALSDGGAEVHSIVHGTGRGFVIVLRWDNTIQTFCETGAEGGLAQGTLSVDLRCFNPFEAKSLAFSDTLNRVAVGGRSGMCIFFSFFFFENLVVLVVTLECAPLFFVLLYIVEQGAR